MESLDITSMSFMRHSLAKSTVDNKTQARYGSTECVKNCRLLPIRIMKAPQISNMNVFNSTLATSLPTLPNATSTMSSYLSSLRKEKRSPAFMRSSHMVMASTMAKPISMPDTAEAKRIKGPKNQPASPNTFGKPNTPTPTMTVTRFIPVDNVVVLPGAETIASLSSGIVVVFRCNSEKPGSNFNRLSARVEAEALGADALEALCSRSKDALTTLGVRTLPGLSGILQRPPRSTRTATTFKLKLYRSRHRINGTEDIRTWGNY
mmetsp:Transcript_29683/g.80252  ORF Transcript_29683/g.80252 Transcript_29683/m.80252 type:complete len:263 (+) Transcript_29683:886-1674(+)